VQGFLIPVEPSSDPDFLSVESFDFPGIRQAIRGSVDELLQKKTILLLRNFPSKGTDILLCLLLRAILSLVAVLALLRILLRRLASSFLGAATINGPNENRTKQGDSYEHNTSRVHCLYSYRVVGDSVMLARGSFEATIPMFVLRWGGSFIRPTPSRVKKGKYLARR